MGERKVLNRYFPPDFDPSLVPKRKWDPYKQVEVRMMIPFSMQCLKCGEFMYRGKKFNSRKEDVIGDDYLGVRKYRFYIKCAVCSNEIAFKTDPEHQDYVCESGATRNFETWKQQGDAESAHEKSRKEETEGSAMAELESRTLDSKIEMDILDALDEIKAYNERNARLEQSLSLDPDAVLKKRAGGSTDDAPLTVAERAELDAFRKRRAALEETAADKASSASASASASSKPRRGGGPRSEEVLAARFDDDDDDDDDDDVDARPPPLGQPAVRRPPEFATTTTTTATAAAKRAGPGPELRGTLKRRRLPAAAPPAPAPTPAPAPASAAATTEGLGLLAGYGTSSGGSD